MYSTTNFNSISFQKESGTLYCYIFSIDAVGDARSVFTSEQVCITKINLSDYTVEQKVFTISTAAFRFGKGISTIYYSLPNFFLFVNNYLYLYAADTTKIYKINVNDETDITELVFAEGIPDANITGKTGLLIQNDYGYKFLLVPFNYVTGTSTPVVSYDTVEISNDTIKTLTLSEELMYNQTDVKGIVPLDDTYAMAYTGRYHIVVCLTNYKATINNLETPISKTINEQMKITYTIKEIGT